ncbi:MAG: hypothetical protein AAGA30_08590 [Planctomycetota bacterium]
MRCANLVTTLLFMLPVVVVHGQVFNNGDILFTETIEDLFLIQSETGFVVDLLDNSSDIVFPDQVAVWQDNVYLTESGELYRIDPLNNSVQFVNDFGSSPREMLADNQGNLIVSSFTDGIVSYNLDNNSFTTIYNPGLFAPRDITFASNNAFYVSDFVDGTGLVTIDGQYESISNVDYEFLASSDSGELYGIEGLNDPIVRIDTVTGQEEIVATGFSFVDDFEVDMNGDLVVLGRYENESGAFRVDLESGEVVWLTSVLGSVSPRDLTIVRNVTQIPEPSSLVFCVLLGMFGVGTVRRSRT